MELLRKIIITPLYLIIWLFAKIAFLWAVVTEPKLNRDERPEYKLFISHSWTDELYKNLTQHLDKMHVKYKNYSIAKNSPLDIGDETFLQLDYELYHLMSECDIFVINSDEKAFSSISHGKWMKIEMEHADLLGKPKIGIVDDYFGKPSEAISNFCDVQTSLKSRIIGRYLNLLYVERKNIKMREIGLDHIKGGLWQFGKIELDSATRYYKMREPYSDKRPRKQFQYLVLVEWLSKKDLRGDSMKNLETSMDAASESVKAIMVLVHDSVSTIEWVYYVDDKDTWSTVLQYELHSRGIENLVKITYVLDSNWNFHDYQFKTHASKCKVEESIKVLEYLAHINKQR